MTLINILQTTMGSNCKDRN